MITEGVTAVYFGAGANPAGGERGVDLGAGTNPFGGQWGADFGAGTNPSGGLREADFGGGMKPAGGESEEGFEAGMKPAGADLEGTKVKVEAVGGTLAGAANTGVLSSGFETGPTLGLDLISTNFGLSFSSLFTASSCFFSGGPSLRVRGRSLVLPRTMRLASPADILSFSSVLMVSCLKENSGTFGTLGTDLSTCDSTNLGGSGAGLVGSGAGASSSSAGSAFRTT